MSAKNEDLYIVAMTLDATNEDIIDKMRLMKAARENRTCRHVVCLIGGFNHDRRELYEIPEVRAFCRRLVGLGFHSYLDFLTAVLDIGQPDEVKIAWGAVEVWLCSEGTFRKEMMFHKKVLAEWKAMVLKANDKADALIGPMRDPA